MDDQSLTIRAELRDRSKDPPAQYSLDTDVSVAIARLHQDQLNKALANDQRVLRWLALWGTPSIPVTAQFGHISISEPVLRAFLARRGLTFDKQGRVTIKGMQRFQAAMRERYAEELDKTLSDLWQPVSDVDRALLQRLSDPQIESLAYEEKLRRKCRRSGMFVGPDRAPFTDWVRESLGALPHEMARHLIDEEQERRRQCPVPELVMSGPDPVQIAQASLASLDPREFDLFAAEHRLWRSEWHEPARAGEQPPGTPAERLALIRQARAILRDLDDKGLGTVLSAELERRSSPTTT